MTKSHCTSDRRHARATFVSLAALAAVILSPQGASARGACPEPPAVSAEINAMAPYQRGTNLKNKEAKTFNEEALSGIGGFIKSITSLADEAAGGDAAAAECFGATMTKWVKSNPLTAASSDQASYEQQWSLATISLAIIKARAGGARISPEVEGWLRTVSGQVRAFHDSRQLKNNHAAWAALAVGAAAYITRDEDSWRWAMGREAMVIGQIQEDGTLPKELSRGPRASSYHVFAAMPLLALNLLRTCRGGLDAGQADRMKRLQGLLDTVDGNQQFLAARASGEQLPTTAMPSVKALEGKGTPNFASDKLGGNIDNLRRAVARCR